MNGLVSYCCHCWPGDHCPEQGATSRGAPGFQPAGGPASPQFPVDTDEWMASSQGSLGLRQTAWLCNLWGPVSGSTGSSPLGAKPQDHVVPSILHLAPPTVPPLNTSLQSATLCKSMDANGCGCMPVEKREAGQALAPPAEISLFHI